MAKSPKEAPAKAVASNPGEQSTGERKPTVIELENGTKRIDN